MVAFQPGGAGERTKLLQALTNGLFGETVVDVFEGIRHWRRNANRASELRVTLPDALVLVGALQRASDFLSGKSAQVAYRLNLEHLQAEAEEMKVNSQMSGLGQAAAKHGAGKVNVKSLSGLI